MQIFLLLLMISAFASEENTALSSILVKIEEDEYIKTNSPKYIGLSYVLRQSSWRAARWSKNERTTVHNGTYKDEETAAHATDTLARKLIANGEKGHKLNFPDDHTEVYPEKTSHYIGVTYIKTRETWGAARYNKKDNKMVSNGTSYKDEETAAHASDTLARKFIKNGEQHRGLKLNFPDDNTEVNPEEKASNYIGVAYNKRDSIWFAYRHNKKTNKTIHNGTYKDEETAAHASDNLARKLIANGEKGHKLNFADDAENQKSKRKRPPGFDKFGSDELYKNL